jgi:hypothetical protein
MLASLSSCQISDSANTQAHERNRHIIVGVECIDDEDIQRKIGYCIQAR